MTYEVTVASVCVCVNEVCLELIMPVAESVETTLSEKVTSDPTSPVSTTTVLDVVLPVIVADPLSIVHNHVSAVKFVSVAA